MGNEANNHKTLLKISSGSPPYNPMDKKVGVVEEDDVDEDAVSSASSSPPQATITRERDINTASINDRSFRLIYLFSFMNGQLPVRSFLKHLNKLVSVKLKNNKITTHTN